MWRQSNLHPRVQRQAFTAAEPKVGSDHLSQSFAWRWKKASASGQPQGRLQGVAGGRVAVPHPMTGVGETIQWIVSSTMRRAR